MIYAVNTNNLTFHSRTFSRNGRTFLLIGIVVHSLSIYNMKTINGYTGNNRCLPKNLRIWLMKNNKKSTCQNAESFRIVMNFWSLYSSIEKYTEIYINCRFSNNYISSGITYIAKTFMWTRNVRLFVILFGIFPRNVWLNPSILVS